MKAEKEGKEEARQGERKQKENGRMIFKKGERKTRKWRKVNQKIRGGTERKLLP